MAEPGPDLSRRRFLGAAAVTGAALAVPGLLAACNVHKGGIVDQDVDPNASWGDSLLLEPPFEKPDVTFTDTDGEPFPLREKTEGKLTLLFFGYTHCPDVCPVYLSTVAGARERIGAGPGSRPMVLFVGVDRARDTPEYMKSYLRNIDPTFIGLTAEEDVINGALADLALPEPVFYEPDENGRYAVDHPARITVFSPDNLAHRMYPSDVRQQQWVKDLPRLDQGVYE